MICPVALRDDANQLARALGLGPEDDQTFGATTYSGAGGGVYCVASFEPAHAWFDSHANGLPAAPAWGADMQAAQRALDRLVIDPDTPEISGQTLLGFRGIAGADAIAATGLVLDIDLSEGA